MGLQGFRASEGHGRLRAYGVSGLEVDGEGSRALQT